MYACVCIIMGTLCKGGVPVSAQEIERYSNPVDSVIQRESDIDKQTENDESSELYQDESSDDIAAADNESATDNEDELTFNVWEYRIEGNNVLDRTIIEKTIYPFLGPDKTIEIIEEARTALEKAYHANGFGTVFVDIPEQEVEEGIVILQITEGRIERVKISGSRYYSLGKIRERVPVLEEGTVPNLPEVQEQVASLNSGMPGRRVTPVLKPGRLPGTVEVELKVDDDHPLKGSWVKLNDRYSVGTSRLRLDTNIQYHNLWQMGHDASIGYIVSPEDPSEVQVIAGTYVIRFPGSEHVVALYGVDTASNVASVGSLNTVGAGTILGGTGVLNLQPMGDLYQTFTFSGSYKDFKESSFLNGNQLVRNAPISYVSFSGSYVARWDKPNYETRLFLNGYFSPRTFGNTEEEFDSGNPATTKRAGAKPNFAYMNVNLFHQYRFQNDTQFRFQLAAQASDSPLVSNEQFFIGGMVTESRANVRGYLESQELADDGFITSIEVRSPSIANYIAEYINEFRFLAFFDGARARIQEPLPDQNSDFSLASTGVGFTVEAFNKVNADVQWAVALKDVDDIESGDSRIHFQVGYQF